MTIHNVLEFVKTADDWELDTIRISLKIRRSNLKKADNARIASLLAVGHTVEFPYMQIVYIGKIEKINNATADVKIIENKEIPRDGIIAKVGNIVKIPLANLSIVYFL